MGVRNLLVVVGGLWVLTACGSRKSARAPENGGGDVLVASAPKAFSLDHLGRPHSGDFVLLAGESGRSLVDEQKLRHSPQHRLDHLVVEVTSESAWLANASAWGFVEAGTNYRTDQRYFVRRLAMVEEVVELDETDGVDSGPDAAVYYPWRVHLGWSYEVVCTGRQTVFGADFSAQFLSFSGEVSHLRTDGQVSCSAHGHGIEFDHRRAVFAKNLDEISKRFRSSEPVPVMVEWRRIPGRTVLSASEEMDGCGDDCGLCRNWIFDGLEWRIPDRKSDGMPWDGDDSPPDVQVTMRLLPSEEPVVSEKSEKFDFSWQFSRPVRLQVGDQVQFVATDIDVVVDDPIATLVLSVPDRDEGGGISFGNGQARLLGHCDDP